MNQDELYGYLAGFFDADGCICKDISTGFWRVSACNIVPSALERFVSAFGGKVVRMRKGDIPDRQPIYEWRVSSQGGMICCEALLPYLIVKRAKVEQALGENLGLKRWPTILGSPERKRLLWRLITTIRKELAGRRKVEAWNLRSTGMSYREIMRELDYSGVSGAFGAVLAGSRTQHPGTQERTGGVR